MSREPSHTLRKPSGQQRPGLLREFSEFLKHNKKWWLLPIVLFLLMIAVLVLLSGSTDSPFIYSIF